MTTTHDVPMPEPDVYRYEHWIDGPREEWSTILLDHTFSAPWQSGYVKGEPHFSLPKLRAYADARCAKLQEERDGKQKQIHRRANAMNAVYAELQRVAPWSESNDMDWADEMICGIGLLAQERDALAEKVKAMKDDARRLDWFSDDERTVYVAIGGEWCAQDGVRGTYAGTTAREAIDAAIDAAGGTADADS